MRDRRESSVRSTQRDPAASRLVPCLVFACSFFFFFSALSNGFVDWDDEDTLVTNLNYRGLGWVQLRWMFTTLHMGHYQPLSWLSFSFDYLVWGMDPRGYHLTSLLIHAANAVIFYFVSLDILRRSMVGAIQSDDGLRWAAGFAALLFAIHPLRVESVAWATERRDVLSGFFFLATVWFYLKSTRADAAYRRNIIASWLAYFVSLLSKASGMTLPLVLLILDLFVIRRWPRGETGLLNKYTGTLLLEKVPYFVLAVAFGVIAAIAQHQAGALKTLENYGAARRAGQAFYGLVFYLWKTLLPMNLSPLYETPFRLGPKDWLSFGFAGAIVCTVTILLWRNTRLWPTFAAWICYVILLLPMLGLVQSGPQLVADRYSYLACLSWAVLAAAGLFYCWRNFSKTRPFAIGLALLIVIFLGLSTWKQVSIWQNSETLWSRAIQIFPTGPRILTNYGNVLMRRGEIEKSMDYFHEALRIEPAYSIAHNKLAIAFVSRGQLHRAIEGYREAIRLSPNYSHAHNNLGVALALSGDMTQAVAAFQAALRIDPKYEDAQRNLKLAASRIAP